MGKHDKFKEKKESAYKRNLKQIETKQGKKDPLIVLSFKNFDINQGQSFDDWEAEQLLSVAINKLRALCQYTIPQATNAGMLKIYTKVPLPPESGFEHPKHIPPDIDWCSMHIGNKPCVIGYFEDNIFQIVFLDKEHEFWISKKKNT
ncbi:MAG: hypothetical protein NW218_16130 [Saprospiraceae bacterium]|nr:hypothetical protein [Saprospiraceae bacterium]